MVRRFPASSSSPKIDYHNNNNNKHKEADQPSRLVVRSAHSEPVERPSVLNSSSFGSGVYQKNTILHSATSTDEGSGVRNYHHLIGLWKNRPKCFK